MSALSDEIAGVIARHDARVGAGVGLTPDSPGRYMREPQSAGQKFFDVISRPEYASANFFGAIMRGGGEDPFSAAWEGITGRRRYDFIDLAHEELGLSDKPFFQVPDARIVPDILEQIAQALMSPSGLTGVALGFALDPLSWVAPFKVTKVGALGRTVKAVRSERGALLAGLSREARRIQALNGPHAAQAWLREQAPRFHALELPRVAGTTPPGFVKPPTLGRGGKIEFPAGGYITPGSKFAREWEDYFAKHGHLPEELAATLGEQAKRGQLSVLSLVTPMGRSLVEGPAGAPVADAASRLAELARQTPQVKNALQIFSHFNIPPGFMGGMAEWRARRRLPVDQVEKMLRATHKLLKAEGAPRPDQQRTLLKALEGTPRVSEQRLASAARTAAVSDRLLGTGDFVRKTQLETLGGQIPELDMTRQELGLAPGTPLMNRYTVNRGVALSQLDVVRTDPKFLGIEWVLSRPGPRGETRILIDKDARPSADTIRKQLLEVDRMLGQVTDTAEAEALHQTREQLQRSLGYALQDPVFQRPWRLIAYAQQQGRPTRSLIATETPVLVGRSGSLADLEPIIQDLTQGQMYPMNIVTLTDDAYQAYLRRTQAMDPFTRLLSERARLAARLEETVGGLLPHLPATAGLPTPFERAHRLLTENLDPDLQQLERVDRALERLGATSLGLQRGKRLKGKVQSLVPLSKAKSILQSIDQGRFAGLPDIIRQVALELEELYDNLWTVEAARGITRSRVPNYVPRIRNEDFALTPWIRGFGHKGPMVERKMPFSRQREFMREEGITQVNDLMNEEWFLEDLLTGLGLRTTASARAIAYHDFLNRTLDMFSAGRVTTAQEAARLRRQYAESGEYALYYPKGEVSWYPTRIISDAALNRGRERAAAMGRQRLVELTEAEIKEGFGASWNAPAHLLPREIADHLNRVDQVVNSDRGVAMFADMIRRFRGIWSKWTLFWFPGFIARNIVGNTANMLYSGFRNFNLFRDAQDIQRGKEWSRVTDTGEILTHDTILREASEKGVIDSGWAMSEFFSQTEAGAREWNLVKRFQDATADGKRKMLAEMKEPVVMRLMMRVNGWMENNAKLTLYMDRRLKGDNATTAAEIVRKYLFDYDELRPTERTIKNYILPYYTWTRKNIPLQFEMAARRPAYFANLARAQRLIEASSDPGVEILPQWMHEAMPVRLKESEDGSGFEYLTLRGWLPAADVETALSPLHSALGMLAPWLRIPIERKANYSFWFRRPIEQPRGQQGYFLGLSLDRSDIELLSSIRILSEFDRILPAPANSPLAGFQAPVWDRLIGSSLAGIGLKTYKVQMAQQRRIANAQKERILRELRIHLNRARKRHDLENVQRLEEMIREEERRQPEVVLPLSITGLPTEP